ncbi:putative ParB nuclease [Lactobacillus phage c5]|uniref:ParB nuclease n=1 Tax=Lactobacillus phage c5 TaxID=2892341 RepID=F8J155_9CAUD|nr:ParB-like partition nuclease [Lactobacillus phage c5]ACA63293.1 putative ParB nuclease [Lactobacillus phage c5]
MGNERMNIVYKKVADLVPYENNPRNNEEAVDYVANSIKEFGFKVPVVVDKDNIVVAGHTRLKACKKLGITEVPCIVAEDLTEDQIKAFRIADNKVSEYATWDEEKLSKELSDIMMDMTEFGDDLFTDDEAMDVKLDDEEDNPYSQETHVPQYEPTGDFVDIMDLVDDEKTNELILEIKESNVSDDEKNFLIKAAYRHLVFNYAKIADYYSNASEEMQILMEKSALVIIDINDAIANGYVKLTKVVEDLIEGDDENGK